ncbi:hypothetical protein V5799_008659, partial [Amblyomma americanum]
GRAPEPPQDSTVYPEVYIAVDSHFAKNVNTSNLLGYLVIFMAGVNLKLADLTAPRVQLRLVGLLIGEVVDRSFYWYGKYVDAQQTITNFFRHLNPKMTNPDIFFILTGHDLIGLINNAYDPNLSGLSPLSGMCTWGRNALISEDTYESFAGIDVAAHEFGHM